MTMCRNFDKCSHLIWLRDPRDPSDYSDARKDYSRLWIWLALAGVILPQIKQAQNLMII